MKIICLAMSDDNKVQVINGDGVNPVLGLAMCEVSAQHFKELIIEDEIQKRVQEAQEKEVDGE